MVAGNNSLPKPLQILLVEDSEHDVTAFNRALEKGGLKAQITHFVRAEDALPSLKKFPLPYDLVVADYKLPGMTGLALCKYIINRKILLPCIMVTGAGTENIAVQALKSGVNDYLVKDSQQAYLEILPLFLPAVIKKYQDSLYSRIFRKERQVIATISEMFLALDDLQILYEKLPHALARGFDFPVSAILLLAENEKEMIVKGIYGFDDTITMGTQLALDKTTCAQAIAQGQPVLQLDLAENPDLNCFLKDSGINTCLSVPIIGKKSQVMGTLVLADYKKRPDAKIHISALQDISHHLGQEIERKLVENFLLKARTEWAVAMDASEDAVYILDVNRHLLTANKAFYSMTGTTPETALGRFIEHIVHPEGEKIPCPVCQAQKKMQDAVIIMEPDNPDNPTRRPIEITIKIVLDDHKKPISILMKLHDLTAQRKVEDELRHGKQQWEKTFDSIPDIITIQDKDMHIVRANRAAHKFFQARQGELDGKPCYQIFRGISEPCPGCPLLNTLKDINNHSEIMQHKNLGKIFHVSSSAVIDDNGDIQSIIHIARDITEQKRLEQELFQSHKMEAIGTLAGGIAHDFNNILSAIMGFTELAKSGLDEKSEPAADLVEVLKASQRATKLVKQILTFSCKGEIKKGVLRPYSIIKEALEMMRASLPATIEIQENLDPETGTMLGDPTKIHQIIVNLCTNALHSMEEQTGTLNLTLKQIKLDEGDLLGHPDILPGQFIELTVKDTGCGMDQKTLQRIFEPYFTTKATGKGSGLGLSVVLGIVQDCKGMIRVESEPEKGSVFHVYFPTIVEETNKFEKPEDKEPLPTGMERILFVDDEALIAALQKTFLSRLGYMVTAKTSSQEALALFKNDPQSFDLLITDQTMPVLSGARLAKEVLSIRPDMPIILCTGYSATLSAEQAKKMGIKKYLFRPVDRKELVKTIRTVLDEN